MSLPQAVSDVTTGFLEEVDGRLPGRLTGLLLHGSLCWGEFFRGSDVDFVAVWDEVPRGEEVDLLRAAHEATRARFPTPTFDGFHCTTADLAGPPSLVGPRPVFYEGSFAAAGTIDINPVTWHELAERGIAVRGVVPAVHADPAALLEHTRTNLDTYWRVILSRLEEAGPDVAGRDDATVAWVGLGAPRLHHLLATGRLTSKSGAGRYVRDTLDRRWSMIAQEALRIREEPWTPSLYDDPAERGRDTYDLLAWVVEDRGLSGRDG